MISRHRLAVPLALLALLALVVMAAPARADESGALPLWGQSRGFSIGLKYLVDGLGVKEAGTPFIPIIDDMGSGLTLVGGYTFTPHFHTRVTAGSARHRADVDGLHVQHSVATAEAHYRFLPDRQVCPYVFGSLGGTDVKADHGPDHLKFTGGMAGLGAGTLVSLTPRFVMDVTVRVEGVNWSKAEVSQDQPGGGTLKYEDAIEDTGTSTRLELGFLWQF